MTGLPTDNLDPRIVAALDRQFSNFPEKGRLVIRGKLDRKTIEEAYRQKKLSLIEAAPSRPTKNLFDQAEVKFRCVPINGKLIVDFGRLIQWTAFTKEQCEQLGNYLIETAPKLDMTVEKPEMKIEK